MKIIRNICRVLLGLVFMFSGFVKGIDPFGSSIKFTEYLHSFHLGLLEPVALLLGVLLALTEFSTGVALVLNYRTRFFSWVALFFMSFFTLLTLYIAIDNSVTDCGCFGDAVKLTNWQTFYKNIVLIAITIFVFIKRNQYTPLLKSIKLSTVLYAVPILIYVWVCIYSYRHLPVIDFLPFKVGVNISDAMQIPKDAPAPVYKNTFYYKNKHTGEIKKFDESNYPWRDSLNWEFSKMDEPVLMDDGYEPVIKNFSILTPNGDDVKDFFLHDDNYTFMLVSSDVLRASVKTQGLINRLAVAARKNGMNFICLTASMHDEVEQFRLETSAPYEFFQCDETTLKSMIRSNPGLILTHKGTILHKWHYNDIPVFDEIRELRK